MFSLFLRNPERSPLWLVSVSQAPLNPPVVSQPSTYPGLHTRFRVFFQSFQSRRLRPNIRVPQRPL